MITDDAARTLIHVTLNADTTLADANHLTSAGRIFKSLTRPAGFANPAMTLRLLPAAIVGEQKFKDEWLLWVNLYLKNKSDLTPDMERSGRIESRIDVLLDGKKLSDANVSRLLINRHLPGRALPVDTEASNETAWQFQYYVEAS